MSGSNEVKPSGRAEIRRQDICLGPQKTSVSVRKPRSGGRRLIVDCWIGLDAMASSITNGALSTRLLPTLKITLKRCPRRVDPCSFRRGRGYRCPASEHRNLRCFVRLGGYRREHHDRVRIPYALPIVTHAISATSALIASAGRLIALRLHSQHHSQKPCPRRVAVRSVSFRTGAASRSTELGQFVQFVHPTSSRTAASPIGDSHFARISCMCSTDESK